MASLHRKNLMQRKNSYLVCKRYIQRGAQAPRVIQVQMERIDNMEIFIGILLGLLINLFIASLMNTVAKNKGYENSNTFVLVLLFGFVGILYVISLPDLVERQQREDILNVLLEIKQGDKGNGNN